MTTCTFVLLLAMSQFVQNNTGELHLFVTDPSGLVFDLVESRSDSREPWIPTDVSKQHAIRGLHSVTLTIRHAEPTIAFLQELLGFTPRVGLREGIARLWEWYWQLTPGAPELLEVEG